MRNYLLLASVLVSVGYGCAAGTVAFPEDPGASGDAGSANGGAQGSGTAGDPAANGRPVMADGGGPVDAGPSPVTDAGATAGLPCDVQALLQSKCVACHSSPPVNGAPMALLTYADLTAAGRSNPAQNEAQLALARMQSTTAPMPPAGSTPATATELAAFQAWVQSGIVRGSCGAPDGGLVGVGVDAGPSPYDTPVTCSSGKTSTASEGATMQPGNTCISCHANQGGEAPVFTIAGTVYKTAHEPTNCAGVNVSGATVIITDANGKTLTLGVNGAGNFYSSAAIATPFHAQVVYNGNTRAMSAAQTSGDCNSCHTESGASGAPGRIMLP